MFQLTKVKIFLLIAIIVSKKRHICILLCNYFDITTILIIFAL